MRLIIKITILLFSLLSIISCFEDDESQPTKGKSMKESMIYEIDNDRFILLQIGPRLKECIGVVPQKCLLVREEGKDEWTLFYSQIESFDYEEGYEYEILVEKSVIVNPPMDSSKFEYKLIEIISKKVVDLEEAD